MLKRLPHLAVFLIAASLYLAGLLAPLERALIDMRFRLLQRDASGGLVLVQIDPRSLQEFGVWPWPRKFHADLIERLFAAGVREVAMDIDLSARSDPDADRAFARVLAGHEAQVILPAFRQPAAPGMESRDLLDSTPLAALREHAQLGAVNMAVDPDGLVRHALNSSIIEGTRHASMFTLLAGPAYLDLGSFLIDYAIDPWTLPRLSYADVLNGRVAPERLAGKRVIVGSSAAELGDNFAVPVYRTLPGHVLQALAYESLVQGRALRSPGAPVVLALAAILALLLGPIFNGTSWRRGAVIAGASVVAIEAAGLAVQAAAPISLDTTPWLAVVVLGFGQSVFRAVSAQDLQLFRQRMAMAYRRALMNLVVQDSFDGIIITDFNGNIEVFNNTAAAMLGCDAREVIGHPLQDVLPVAVTFMSRMARESGAAGNEAAVTHSGPHECRIERSGADWIAIELVISQFLSRRSRDPRQRRTAERLIYNFTFRDVTDRQRAQEAERTASQQARAANRAKSEFLANMSHELRTPLNAILGFSDMIKSEVLGRIKPPQYLPYIKDINDCGRHLLGIINDILEVSKVELGQVQFDEDVVDLRAMAGTGCRILRGWPASKERQFEAHIAPDTPGLLGDARLIKQILVNLLSNAVKYSKPGDRVALRVFADQSGRPTIEVEDSGIGIEPSAIPFLTQPFYQVDSALARRHEGTGLGLCLVSAYVELHGGSLRIESQPDVGTKVSIRFPQARVVAAPQIPYVAEKKIASA